MPKGFGQSKPHPCTFQGIVLVWLKMWKGLDKPAIIQFKKRHVSRVRDVLPQLKTAYPENAFKLVSRQGDGVPLLVIAGPKPEVHM